MTEIASDVLVIPLAIAFYGSGLLLWPLRCWLRRKRTTRGKSLGFVFLGRFISYIAVLLVALIHPGMLEHGYYWFIIMIFLNVLFTIAGVAAWIRDSHYETQIDTSLPGQGQA